VVNTVTDACIQCDEEIADEDLSAPTVVIDADGVSSLRWLHAACQLLGTVGHEYGVCSCTGYDTSSWAAAQELWKRIEAFGAAYLNNPHTEGRPGD
jgi:hypothetical protein